VAIARALYANSRGRSVVVLDEPTAHLDVRSEAEFYGDVTRAARGATIVLISHRFSTIRHADRIVLLSDGRVAESGRHEELMRAGGEYARLFTLQAARFQRDRKLT
jgi:ATP-binding cassette subfamily B protein